MFRRIVVFVILVLLGWVNVNASSDTSSEIERLKKIIAECKDPLKIPPGIFQQIKILEGVQPRPDFKKLRNLTNQGLVHVYVDSVIYPSIQTNFDQFVSDLQADSFSVIVTKYRYQTPEDIRAVLRAEYSSGLVGVILVGDIPAVKMKTTPPSYYYTSYFPTDYFYMDLNGTWVDYDYDMFYDSLYGNLEPEIWAGRITPSHCLFGDEVKLLNQYFIKNHAYRTGSLSLPDRALGYLELTWYPSINTYLGWVYDDVDVISNEDSTTALNYKYMLQQGYEWVHLLAHSSPWGSTFFLHGETYGGGSVFSYEIPVLNPQANFVLLNACSNAKYTETNNIGQAYLFGSDYGLAVIGETRIMYGDDFQYLYAGLRDGKNIGESFLDWIWWNYDWFWGCNIFGDPTLKPHGNGKRFNLAGFSSHPMIGTSTWDTSSIDNSPFTNGDASACVDHSGNIWVAWDAGRDVRSNIWASHYNGSSWSEPEEPAFSVPWDFHPSMVTDRSGKVWIFWQSYRESDNGIDGWDIYGVCHNGSAWSSPYRITTAAPYDVEPKSAVDSSGKVWVVWRTERTPGADIAYSYYNGTTWSSNFDISLTWDDDDRDPVITVGKDGKVWVVWYTKRNYNWDLYAKYCGEHGWSSEIRVTTDPGYDLQPSVTADSLGRVWVVWRSNRNGNLDIYSKYYNGVSWSPDIPVTTDPGEDLNPSVTYIGGDQILVTWQSNRDGNWNVYQSIYYGTWSAPEPVTTDAGNQIQPVAFYDGNKRYGSVFQGDQEVNWNIYYSYTTAPWFAPAVNYGVGDEPQSVFCADLDGDSDLDLAAVNGTSNDVSILKNNGDGTFQSAVNYGTGNGPWSIFCADLDGDTDLDLAVVNYVSGDVSILKNNGDGTFQTKVDYLVGYHPTSVFCAELDGDCDLDLAVANDGSNSVSILKNNGDGTFVTKVDYETDNGPQSVFCADLDGDGDLDLAVANDIPGIGDVSILKNNGDGTFQLDSSYTVGNHPTSVFCADLDGDTDMDLAVANWVSYNVSFLKNNGDGTFQTAVNYEVGGRPRSVFCTDLDGDYDLDLALANSYDNNVSIIKNNGDGTFQTAVNYEVGGRTWSVFCADLDEDSDLDLAVANAGSDSISILMNLTQVPGNSTPYPFPLLSPADAETTSSVVEFHWAETQDVNLSDQIRYDLYLSTVPGFNPDSTTIYDSLVCSEITDTLHVGRYYWKVKAYDNWGTETWSKQIWHFVYFIHGDANMDETIELGDVVYLITYLYKNGPAPDPLAAGDVNCDGIVELGDVVYLISYLYKSGPPPGC